MAVSGREINYSKQNKTNKKTNIQTEETVGVKIFLSLPGVQLPTFWTLTLGVNADLFWCLHVPLKSAMDYRNFDVCVYVIFLHATTHEGPQFMDNRAFVECTESYSGGSPIWSRSIMLDSGYWEQLLLLCSTITTPAHTRTHTHILSLSLTHTHTHIQTPHTFRYYTHTHTHIYTHIQIHYDTHTRTFTQK